MVENVTKSYWHDSLIVFARMSGWVAGPIIIGLFAGKWLDAKFGTAPVLFAVTIGVAFLASSFGIVREARRYMKALKLTETAKETTEETNEINNP